jgi:hypothetical protein
MSLKLCEKCKGLFISFSKTDIQLCYNCIKEEMKNLYNKETDLIEELDRIEGK